MPSWVDDRATPRYIANATGSVTCPDYVPPSADSWIPAGDWAWSTNVSVRDNTTWQSFALDTTTLRGVPKSDIPFHVCVSIFTSIPRETYINGQNDPGDCSSMINQDCIDAMTRLATEAGRDDEDCGNVYKRLARDRPAECEEAFGVDAAGIGYELFSSTNAMNDDNGAPLPTCGGESPNLTLHTFDGLAIGSAIQNSSNFNDTLYDETTYRVVPFLTTIVSDESAQASLVCVRARDVVHGSRVPVELVTPEEGAGPGSEEQSPDPESAASRIWGEGVCIGSILGIVGLLVYFVG